MMDHDGMGMGIGIWILWVLVFIILVLLIMWLVMVPHRLSFWDYMLNRSNTREMALRSHIPLLALPNPRL